jgi:hypothetical protein
VEKEGLFRNLQLFFSLFSNDAAGIRREFLSLKVTPGAGMTIAGAESGLQSVYGQAVRIVEDTAAAQGFPDDLTELQRGLYAEIEYLLGLGRRDGRHRFLVVIPVADRPAMLRNCIRSLIVQCRTFGYGGTATGSDGKSFYRKIDLLVFDDSKEEANRDAIREITEEAGAAGIRGYYIGLQEQAAFLGRLKTVSRERLTRLIGEYKGSPSPRKGASLTRNIAYLYIHGMLGGRGVPLPDDASGHDEKTLIYFLDSDEKFRIRIGEEPSSSEISFINYFYWIDRIFRSADIEVMTGKVVGDPPVTPAVMINTFLEDLILFFGSLAGLSLHGECPFHESRDTEAFSAEYHDLGKLFGYRPSASAKKYRCDLEGVHTIQDCFDHLSKRATEFFYGLHPTRVQCYHHAGGFMRTEQARTVYTGNYVFRREGLRHFIPFADLGLRMAGPTLGRILKSKIKARFVSANLPLLHKRTASGTGAEFRSGIIDNGETIDLSPECCRQFWGDVMLFSVEALTARGYPVIPSDYDTIAATVRRTQGEIWEIYGEKFSKTDGCISQIRHHLSAAGWRNSLPDAQDAVTRFGRFCDLSESNFGTTSGCFRKLSEQIGEGGMLNRIIEAINLYGEDERAWSAALEEIAASAEAGQAAG